VNALEAACPSYLQCGSRRDGKSLKLRKGRTKELFRELVSAGLLEDDGATKGKKYRKN